jgi:hypothetical protein
MTISRNETAFFNEDSVTRAIVGLASAQSLVIYCGAGVTIDRTGLGWSDLIARLFEMRGEAPNGRDPSEEEVRVLSAALPGPALASILMSRMEAHRGGEREARTALTLRLQQALYQGSAWQRSALVANIVRLALTFVQLARPVTIVTSNYDTYLEEEYVAHRRWLEAADAVADIPGLVATAPGRTEPFERTPPRGNVGSVQILYLHGRVPRDGLAEGDLILSENDYAMYSGPASTALEELLQQTGSAVLILGSSLTDPPLLTALSRTRRRADRDTVAQADSPTVDRIAVLPAISTGLTGSDVYSRLCQHLKARTNYLGVDLLVADFHFQIAQLCQEIVTSVGLPQGPDAYPNSPGAQYGRRLAGWWQIWEKRDAKRGPDWTYELLREQLSGIRDYLGQQEEAHDTAAEPLKIELWVRYRPGRKSRCLALWGSSAGVLRDRSIIRTEDLCWQPSIASVKAFIEGRPQYVGLSDLTRRAGQVGEMRGRWRSFLAVPIRIDLADGVLPVGMMTLASTYEPARSNIPDGAVQAMEDLVGLLTATGEELLSV